MGCRARHRGCKMPGQGANVRPLFTPGDLLCKDTGKLKTASEWAAVKQAYGVFWWIKTQRSNQTGSEGFIMRGIHLFCPATLSLTLR